MVLNDVVRNVSLLSMCQALAQTQMVLIFSVTTFIGAALAPVVNLFGVPFSLATLPITLQFTFMTISTLPAALLMKKLGRANGFILFILIGVLGIAVCLIALVYQDFILFCVGSSFFGASAGSKSTIPF